MDDIQTKTIHTYKKISGFVFHYLIFFVAAIVALLIFQRVISQSTTINVFQTNDNLLMQKSRLVAKFSKFLKQNIKDNDLQIKVLQ
ncbi:MAG: hypothetical protein WCP92_09345 [bacterium]